jgi:Tol biopolymer transport system component
MGREIVSKVFGVGILLILLAVAIGIFGDLKSIEPEKSKISGKFFNSSPPVNKAEVFMDGFISTSPGDEMNAAFSPEGDEFYYCAKHNGKYAIFRTVLNKDGWSKPGPLWFTGDYTDRDFTMSPDGFSLFFGSTRPVKIGDSESARLDIFVTEKGVNGNWSYPRNIGQSISPDYGKNYPSIASTGNLYFFACIEGESGNCDIYISKQVDGKYKPAEKLGPNINSEYNDWDQFIAPDESYIIWSSQDRLDSIGKQDLYISFKKEDGSWTEGVNMGPRVNSRDDEICPSVSCGGKCFFFTTRRRGNADIYWINAGIINDLKEKVF